jgi:glycosyltransferase involved in cell wall biosynthesis
MLQHKKLINLYENTGRVEYGVEKLSTIALMYSDIMHQYSVSGEDALHRWQALKSKRPTYREDTLLVPPAIIYDADDNADFVHPFNVSFAFMGVRGYPDAHFLKPGEILVYEDAEGNPKELWEDKVTPHEDVYFDIERNLYEMQIRGKLIKEAHGCTAASSALCRYFKEVYGQSNVYHFPNTIVPQHFEHYEVVRKSTNVRILWQGGNSHYIDWFPLRNALIEIVEKYRDKVTFVIYGQQFPWVTGIIPENMIEYHPWTPYSAYKLKRGLLNIDINLCPLVDNVFNRCKSAIKWYEASVWDKPEATLAQKTEPYHEIEHGKTGLLFSTSEEFVEMLSGLIDNPTLRASLGAGAKEWVLANRTPDATIPGLFEFYTETRARQKRDLGVTAVKTFSTADLKEATKDFLPKR